MLVKDFIREQTTVGDLEAEKAIHDLDVLGSALVQLPPEKQDIKVSIVNKLKQMSDSIVNFLARAKTQQVDPQENVTEADEMDNAAMNTIATLKSQIKAVEESDIDEQVKKQFITPLRQTLNQLTKQVKELTKVKDDAIKTAEEAKLFIQDVNKSLITLGNKIQGYTQDDGGMSVSEKDFSTKLKQAVFGKIVDIQEQGHKPADIKEFLEACVNGDVIDMGRLITRPNKDKLHSGNVEHFVTEKHKKMFDIFVKQNIFSYTPGTTSGGIGPGEMALSMMGSPAQKGKTGDLLINGKEIEIKAGGKTGSGGRLNSKALTKPTTGWKVFSKNIAQIMQNAPDEPLIRVTNKRSGATVTLTNSMRGWDGDFMSTAGKKPKLASAYNFVPNVIPLLNSEVLAPYSDQQQTQQLFLESFKAMTGNWDQIKNVDPDQLITDAVNTDGTVDFDTMAQAWARVAYESYHLADGIETIMFLRTDTLNFIIIENGKDFINNFGNLKVSGFVWNDDQQNPTSGFLPKA